MLTAKSDDMDKILGLEYGADDYISSSANFEYDYSQMVYYKGQVNGLENTTAADLLEKGSASYTALSAFNELMFAYSTDTGCLNTYLGYSIAAEGFSTSYVPEFEYAAQEAVKGEKREIWRKQAGS